MQLIRKLYKIVKDFIAIKKFQIVKQMQLLVVQKIKYLTKIIVMKYGEKMLLKLFI